MVGFATHLFRSAISICGARLWIPCFFWFRSTSWLLTTFLTTTMNWDAPGALVLREGYLLKTAGGQGGGGDCVDAKAGTAKIRYFRLVEHVTEGGGDAGDSPSQFMLHYHDSPSAKGQKGCVVIDHHTAVRSGWVDDEAAAEAASAKRNSARRRSTASSQSGNSLAAAFSAPRSASGSIAQAIAFQNSKRNAMRIVTKDRTLFLMSPPQEVGRLGWLYECWFDVATVVRWKRTRMCHQPFARVLGARNCDLTPVTRTKPSHQ